MEFVKKSLSVTDVKIPEGDVIRITDKATGNVLWEKKRNLAPNEKWISRTLADCNFIDGVKITCLSKDAAPHDMHDIRMGYIAPGIPAQNYAKRAYTDTFHGLLRKSGGYEYWTYTKHTGAVFASNYMSGGDFQYIAPSESFSMSENGVMTFYYTQGFYAIANISEDRNFYHPTHYIKVSKPKTATDVRLTYSPKRKEYLVTGGGYQAFTVPETLPEVTYENPAATQSKYSNVKIDRACWCERDNLYYGTLTTKEGYIASSKDGYSWTDAKVFNFVNVLGIVDMTTSNRLCAIAAKKIALSSDGKEWIVKDAPFTSVAGYAYSPEYDMLAVVDDSGKVWLTQKFNYWHEVEAPAKIKFKDFFHFADGIFIGAAYQSDRFYILATQTPIK